MGTQDSLHVIPDPDPSADMAERVRSTARNRSTSALAVWYPEHTVSVGPRDRRADGYEAVVAAARKRGYAVRERSMGGRPVAMTPATLTFVWATPADGDIRERYRYVRSVLQAALEGVDVTARPGEPPCSFCPGQYGLQAGGKLAGFAQRVRADAAAVGGIVLVDDREEIADVLKAVYGALAVTFDPASVGSVADAGGNADTDVMRAAVVDAFRDRTF